MIIDSILFLVIAILTKATDGNTCWSKELHSSVVTWGMRLKQPAFVTLQRNNLPECAKSCMGRSKCKSFSYERYSKLCQLHSADVNTIPITEAEGYIYSEPNGWPRELIGVCADAKCHENSRCVELMSGHICVRTHCDDPPSHPFASVNNGCNAIGCRREYTCDEGYLLTGDVVILCYNSGHWSTRAFRCKDCGHPPRHPFASVDNGCNTLACRRLYTCVVGYVMAGDASIVCDDSALWTDLAFSCRDCGDPPNQALAYVERDCNTLTCRRLYTCVVGYIMAGDASILCDDTAEWTDTTFNCIEGINIVLRRVATQSSTFHDYSASIAVDGIKHVQMESCTQTKLGDEDRWWIVDFGQMAVVSGITMLNGVQCEERLADVSIWIGSYLDTMELCAYYAGPGTGGQLVLVMCSSPMTGQYLKLTGGSYGCGDPDWSAFLQFCEIEAIGYFPDPVPCGEGQFECRTKLCIADDSRCDMINDCGDWSDEVGCYCPDNAFECNNGVCIPFYLRCDGADDCGDRSDEPIKCSCSRGWQCPAGNCIPEEWICDGWDDCGDNADEMGCY